MHKQIIFISVALLTSQTNFACERSQATEPGTKKELRLHFDINKTIVATDAVQGKDLAITVNEIIAEYSFEKWNGTNMQSYHAYLTEQIAAEYPQLPPAHEEFKKIRSERVKQFPNFLSRHPESLARYEKERDQMLQILDKKEIVIFPSFYKAMRWLEEQYPGNYSVFLRTFGKDLPEVVPAIEKNTSLKFVGHGKFQGTKLLMSIQGQTHVDLFSIPKSTHCAIQDDYAYWKSHGFQARGGKCFPIIPQIISMFFDDNAADQHKPILCPVGPNEELENTKELLKSGHIVSVNATTA
jgi:hypothetical protein